ncbi:WD40-repeat-containing domain protein [Boletus reticuloceps]|uniref:WD40-repeat-containing domain protein n=1 Tax=Boletus reticuloceps TaxID=495285 RepID=A0A8I2YRR6_9AGAM|nr:WD40-repeat-containing domain protein [Boletus reticuloceps]
MLADTVGGILGRLKDGVLEVPLPKDSPDEQVDSPEITIKFALTVELRGNVDADELQATDAVNKATEMVNALATPQIVGLAGSVINTGINIATELQTFENTWSVLLKRMALFNKIVAGIAEIHPYTSLAWSVISAANQVLVNQQGRDDRVVRLAGMMSDVFAFVEDAEPLKVVEAHREHIKLLIQQVTECGYFITEYAKQDNFWTRTAKYTFSDVDSKVTDYENKLRDLKAAFLDGITLQSGVTVFRMMNVVQTITKSMDLSDMPYAHGARYVEEKGCLPGTREAIIHDICNVLNNPGEDAPRVCLLTGVAGSGKSAVAHSIARLYDGQQRLGSSYCFLRSDVTRRNPSNFFSTIALDLSDHDSQYKAELCQVVENNRSLRTSISLSEQVRRLIVEPSKHLDTIGPLIVVVDALDESGDQANRRGLLRAFTEQVAENNFPKNLRFLITARPEKDILDELASSPQIVHKQLGDVAEEVVDEDIRKFIRHSLHRYTELESAWPNQVWCRLLVRHSQHLFQWASTARRFIEGDGAIGLSMRERLEILIQRKNVGLHPLDDLYRTILGQLFTLDNVQDKFRDVMALVLALKEPLSLTSLAALFNGDPNIRDIIKPLGSLLDGTYDETKPIRPLHTSFRDFLLDDVRSSAFHVNILPRHSLSLGHASLGCMRKMLKFNICDLEDSRLRNNAVPYLADRVSNVIPPYLTYSCQYWMDHVQHTESTPELLDEITSFFKTFFPFWLEALSLLSLFHPTSYTLSALTACTILRQWAKDCEIATLATEASQFIQLFAPIISESAPHLYLSAMPQTPSSSPLCQLWVNHLQNHLSVTSGHLASWPVEMHTLQGHTNHVTSIAYSPDGAHIVSGSRDKTIRVWNPITGQCVATLPEVNTISVTSVAYSPDGNYIVAGSESIRIWDANTGQHVAGPFQGHRHLITAVAYSPGGSCVVSGSMDKMIRIWDADTGLCVAGPLEGHTDVVRSLAFSPEGSQFVSGSEDNTLRVWNVNTGECMAGPFGHYTTVYSVAYSPDGCYVASGSRDETIRVWDPSTGVCVAGPFQGHTGWIYSVAYSPDGNHIASASADTTIRIWDAKTGQCVAGPYQGHTLSVTSVVYSPDGSCLVSGSWDKTIKIWNLNTSYHVEHTSQGHTDMVTSVAYSPDGNNIVSGSYDGTLKTWNANTGQHVQTPFQNSIVLVSSVIFSPSGRHIIFSLGSTIGIWDTITEQGMRGTAGPVTSVAYSSDGRYIVSGSEDCSIKVWESQALDSVREICYQENGWIELSDGACLCWIPSWARSSFSLPLHTLVLSSNETYKLDFGNFLHGESWASCWK